MKNFEYIFPKNAESIPAILKESGPATMIYAGGTDALARMKEGIDRPEKLVNLKNVEELNYIKASDIGLQIGAVTRLVDLVENESVKKIKGLHTAAQSIGTVQLRNMGTVGGNLCQRPRCWYFRSRHFPCLRKHGEECYAVSGENKYHAVLGGGPCYIVHPSDLAPMLIALDSRAVIHSPGGPREILLQDFFVLPEQDTYRETILKPGEYLHEIMVPATNKRSHYLKFRERKSIDFAIVSVAVTANVSGKKLSQVSIVLGGVAPVPWQAKKAAALLEGNLADDALLQKAAQAELAAAEPLEQNEYKVTLAINLIKRAVRELIST